MLPSQERLVASILLQKSEYKLYESFSRALSHVGIVDWQQKLMGFGCDGASVNMGANALRGLLE